MSQVWTKEKQESLFPSIYLSAHWFIHPSFYYINYSSIYLSSCPSTLSFNHPSSAHLSITCSFIHPYINLSVYKSIHSFIVSSCPNFRPSIWSFIQPSIWVSIHQSIYPYIPSFHPFIGLFVHLSVCLPDHSSIHPFIHSLVCPSIHLFISLCTHLSIHRCVHSFHMCLSVYQQSILTLFSFFYFFYLYGSV